MKGLLVGSIVSVAIGAGVAYADTAIRGSYLALDFGSPAALFTLFAITLLLNPAAGLLGQRWRLSTQDIAVVYIMALFATAIPSMGLTAYLLPYLSGAQYYATPENEWASLFLEHVPGWMVVQDPGAIKHLYEGNPSGRFGVPWKAWLPPLAAWVPFLCVLYLVMIAMMVILRRQWMDHERLLYPLMQAPLAMVQQDRGRLFPTLYRSWVFWLGMAIPTLVGAINGLHSYYEFLPELIIRDTFLIFRETTPVYPALSFTTMGLTYFLSQDIALGIWLFNLLAKIQEGTFNMLGVASDETMEWVTVPILAHQAIGAMCMFVLMGLWSARHHLRGVLDTALRREGRMLDDSGEIMSYRAAVLIVATGLPFLWGWLWLSGLPLWAAGMVLFFGFILFIGLSRMVTEGGFFIARAPINPGNVVAYGFGVEALGTQGVAALGYTFVWAGEQRIFVMAACANALRVAQVIRGSRRWLLWACLLAILLSAVSSIWMQLSVCYDHGGINLSSFYTSLVLYPFNFTARHLNNATSVSWGGWAWTAWGGFLMTCLTLARQRLVWWPVHPMSLPLSSMWMTDTIVLSVFLSWLIKLMILRYGGPALFQRGKPLFIGLVTGQFTSMGMWVVIDGFTGMQDNLVWWL